MAITRYRDYVARISSGPLRGYWGQRLAGALALQFDQLAEGASEALTAYWMRSPTGAAPDASLALGSEYALPRYPEEAEATHLERIELAWPTWESAADEDVLLEQLRITLEDAGFVDPEIFYSSDTGNWSVFVVFYRPGNHPVTNEGPEYGTFTWGDGTTYGPGGITASQIETIRAIVKKWKPGHWVCPFVLFQISGWSYGDGTAWGDPGLVYGGETASIGV